MNKFILLYFLLIFISCRQSSDISYLPTSIGRTDEVLVVMDKELWKGAEGAILQKKFEAPYMVLPQYEPTISYKRVSVKGFDKLFKKYRNILIVGVLDEQAESGLFFRESMGAQKYEQVKEKGIVFTVSKDVWAKPQQVFYLFSNSREELNDYLQKNSNQIMQAILDHEAKSLKKDFVKQDEELKNLIKNKFKINLQIPEEYELVRDEKDFLWLHKELEDGSSNILIHELAYNEQYIMFPYKISGLRDTLGRKFVEGQIPGTYMKTDTVIAPVTEFKDIEGNVAIEMRGLWRLHKDFMGGPFVSHLIYDEKNDRMLLLDGFIFYPKGKKKKHIRQVEAVFSTLEMPQ